MSQPGLITPADFDEPACPWFESTVQLMDGELEPGARAEALHHVSLCDICAPLVRGWSRAAEALGDGLEDAAERAKPALFQLPGNVLRAIAPPPARVGFFQRLNLRFSAFAGLGAAVATVFLLLPVRPGSVAPPTTAAPMPAVATTRAPVARPGLVPVSPNDCHMHRLAFDGADGMVYRTETDGMTVIWVNEHEGA